MSGSVRRLRFNDATAVLAVLIAAFVLVLVLPVAAYATTLHVSTGGNDTTGDGSVAKPYATVQRALNLAHSGDVVSVGPGKFTGSSVMATAGVSLEGAGSSDTTLDGNGGGCVVTVNGIGAGTTISGFTITGGAGGSDGGGIYCHDSSPTITANTITANGAMGGGGIACNDASPVITGNTITGNSAMDGAGIECFNPASAPTITNNTISDNTANTMGGGIDFEGTSTATIMGNTITGNSAANDNGGGIYCGMSSPPITGNTITGNSASTGEGGGIFCQFSSSPPIVGDTIIGNSATQGGGVWAYTAPIVNCIVADNTVSGGYGGGIGISVPGVMCNDTIVGNSGASYGDGIYCDAGGLAITNCIVWDNASDDQFAGSPTYSDVSTITPGVGNILADPSFVSSATGNFRLMAASPCIDHGTSVGAPATDRDGIARPWGAGFDMGAYEYYVPLLHTASKLSAPKSVKIKKWLKISGTLSPSSTPGQVTITMTRKVGKKWKKAGSVKVSLVGGKFSYSFKPKHAGSWHFVASYPGGVAGPTTYTSSHTATKTVKVKTGR